MRILVTGGGRAVDHLCGAFVAKGHQVTLVDPDPEECARIAASGSVLVIQGDGSDPAVLAEAGARSADLFLAMGDLDPDNLIACQTAAQVFGAPRVLAQANDPDNVEIFDQLGVPAFSTTRIISSLVEQRTSRDAITNLLPAVQGRVNITEVVLEAGAPAAGVLLRDLTLPQDSLVAVVVREGRPLVPRGNSRLEAGDRLVLVSLPENHGQALRALVGSDA